MFLQGRGIHSLDDLNFVFVRGKGIDGTASIKLCLEQPPEREMSQPTDSQS